MLTRRGMIRRTTGLFMRNAPVASARVCTHTMIIFIARVVLRNPGVCIYLFALDYDKILMREFYP